MHVPLKHHLFVVALLVGMLFILLILLAMVSLKISPFYTENSPVAEKYLKEEEAVVVVESKDSEEKTVVLPIQKVFFEYIEVVDGCGPHFEGECLNVRSGPGEDYPIVTRLRNGIVLKVGGMVERNGRTWYKITFDEWIRYPERLSESWYVSANYVAELLDEGNQDLRHLASGANTKRIIVDRSEQMLYAYDGEELFMKVSISTGLELTPTPRGTYIIFKKTPSRYMQGPIPEVSDQYYDLPGVPWNLYFTNEGAVIHGAYWHNNFGRPSSHGCVNLPPEQAKKLYTWADVGMQVIVRD